MRSTKIRLTDEFIEGLSEIYSDKVILRVREAVERLVTFPDIGSTLVRQSITSRYGANLRQLSIAPFVLIYRHVDGCVEVLALLYGSSIV